MALALVQMCSLASAKTLFVHMNHVAFFTGREVVLKKDGIIMTICSLEGDALSIVVRCPATDSLHEGVPVTLWSWQREGLFMKDSAQRYRVFIATLYWTYIRYNRYP